MYGDFVVVTGEFNYKFGGIINKTFKVEPGGNIYWDREPLEAQLNMEAVYSLMPIRHLCWIIRGILEEYPPMWLLI